ncbi:hypothetical protein FACS189431_7130 [Alphaproteobacteria bacterium]|nr:hypothetical protein FACS189431_7130 [Alphaproteobacteria bacterium]
MALDTKLHNTKLRQIFQDIYADNELAAQVVFKGGTCLMFFYDIDRFSTDLDFDIRDGVEKVSAARITKIVNKYLTVDSDREKRFTYFWHGSYGKGFMGVKVEINKRKHKQRIVYKDFMGLNVATLAPELMFAQKLCAITERTELQNRDLYDANFMFEQGWDIDQDVIAARQKKSVKEYLEYLTEYLDNDKIRTNILQGLGEVLVQPRKDWAKDCLVDSLLRQIKIRIDSLK